MSQRALNKYRIMWILVMFDLPTETQEDRKIASGFRHLLLEDGFDMLQYSVYIRLCPSKEYVDLHIKRIKTASPRSGRISILTITDKQFGDTVNIWGSGKEPPNPQTWNQVLLF